MNYQKLIDLNPFSYGTMVNSMGQTIEFMEHPLKGQDVPVIAVYHELQLASSTDFYETDDMTADHREYEPLFIDNKLQHGL